ncbi:MAG: GHMP kinase [Anaerolineales bacterium]|nr:GHMP kinase [Anaerolineales bacterium]
MIIVQTPLRVSLFGGGTDFPSFYQQEGGCVLSSAIDKYIFVTIKERFDCKLRVGYTHTEMVDSVDEIRHELIRESLRKTGISQGIEITTMGDIPSEGSGLGSSSTVTVGSLHAMYTFLNEIVPAARLAQEACQIEIGSLEKPIGVQDQYIVALGGLRLLEFMPDGEVKNTRVELQQEQQRLLNENLMLFFTGVTRKADRILNEQKHNIKDRLPILREMKQMAYLAYQHLQEGNIELIGELLHESWQMKKQLAQQISNGNIEAMYAAARKAGATGGKITGAGGGGFLLLYCPHDRQKAVRAELHRLQELPFQVEPDGTKVIFNYRRPN